MSFAGRSTADLIQIALAGGGITLEAAGRSTADLIQIALAGSKKNAELVLKGMAGRSTAELIQIALAGSGRVRFEA